LEIAVRVAALLFLAAVIPFAAGQDAAPTRLMDQTPFDVVTLDKANDRKVYKVYPLKLPGRRVPERPRPADKLRVRLFETEQEYDIAWANIAKLELYEQLVLAETYKLAAEGRLDDAYEQLNFLFTYYPQTPGLAEARHSYLYVSSAAAFRQQKFEEALSLLEDLHAQNASFRASENSPTVLQRLGDVADRLIGMHVESKDYASARALLSRLSRQYRAEGEPFAKKWRQQLEQLAASRRDEARAHVAAGRYAEAYDASAAMLAIWPDIAGGAELVAEVARRYSLVRVGVDHPALFATQAPGARALTPSPAAGEGLSRSLHNVAARRAGRLVERLLVECTALGAEGGKYESPIGQITRSDDSLSLLFRLTPTSSGTAAYDLAQRLLGRATEGSFEYDSAWQQIVASVALRGANEVQIDLRTTHVLPEALLQVPLVRADDAAATAGQPCTVASHDSALTRYAANPSYQFARASQPAEIAEQWFSDPQRALAALKRGEIDILDRVDAGDVAGLKADGALVVARYSAPTTHVLAVRSEHPFLTNSTFRRGLVYGANRELLLNQGVLRGAALPGCRVVSAPFPAPAAGMDLPIYGYDAQIQPRPYDPRLAMALVLLAQGELKAAFEKREREAPRLTPIVLGHPADEGSRIACRGLVKDWKRIGVECKLVEFAPGVFDDANDKCDLVYLQLAAWEPVIDAGRLFGPAGLTPTANEHILRSLREIERARNWRQVRERLILLHRLLHEDTTVLPLWQTIDHFAYRRTLQGLSANRLSLYQDFEQWRRAPALARSQP
jgi:hypothetical protein